MGGSRMTKGAYHFLLGIWFFNLGVWVLNMIIFLPSVWSLFWGALALGSYFIVRIIWDDYRTNYPVKRSD